MTTLVVEEVMVKVEYEVQAEQETSWIEVGSWNRRVMTLLAAIVSECVKLIVYEARAPTARVLGVIAREAKVARVVMITTTPSLIFSTTAPPLWRASEKEGVG